MKFFSSQRFLMMYSGILTVVFAVTFLSGFRGKDRASFDQIDVRRINVVEPDGTVRVVISDKAEFPGIILKNQEYPHPDRKTAGMLFFNDEGTENGGLIFGGTKDKDGTTHSYGHLSFDRYEQDQVFTIDADEEGSHAESGLSIWDRPDWPISELVTRARSDWQKFVGTHPQAHQRIVLGRGDDQSVALRLKDPQGRDRIVITVDANGSPAIKFLDQAGKVVSQLPEQPKNSSQSHFFR